MSQAAARGAGRLRAWLALLVVYVVWGTTYLAIRVGVRDIHPLLFAGVRYVVAGALLYPFASRAPGPDHDRGDAAPRVARQPRSPLLAAGGHGTSSNVRTWASCVVVGVLLLVGGNGGVSVAESTLSSGFAAVLVATVPLWMILFAWPVQRARVPVRAAVGLAIGLAGVAVLVGSSAASGAARDVALVLAASASWGLGSVLGQRLTLPRNALLASAMEMLVGGAVLVVAAAATGELRAANWSSVHLTSWIALAYLIGPGSILAFSAYGFALAHLPVTTVSTYAYVNPIVAVLAGALLLGEHLTLREGIGAALVVASVAIILRRAVDRRGQRAGAAATSKGKRPGRPDPAP